MAALGDPAAPLDPFELADWLERPEIRRALDARDEIRDIRLADKIAAATERALDRMTAVLDADTDLKDPARRAETRRASSSILRLSASFSRDGYAGLRRALRHARRPASESLPERYRPGGARDDRHTGRTTDPRRPCDTHDLATDSGLRTDYAAPSTEPPAPRPSVVPEERTGDTQADAVAVAESLVRALQNNDDPEPDSGIASLRAFLHFASFLDTVRFDDFVGRIRRGSAGGLIGHASHTLHVERYGRGDCYHWATIRVEATHHDGRTHAARFLLEYYHPAGGRWHIRDILPADSG